MRRILKTSSRKSRLHLLKQITQPNERKFLSTGRTTWSAGQRFVWENCAALRSHQRSAKFRAASLLETAVAQAGKSTTRRTRLGCLLWNGRYFFWVKKIRRE